MLRREGWRVNHKRVERTWKSEGLKVPKRQPKRGRLWLNNGSGVRLRPAYKNHVWSYDFIHDRTRGRPGDQVNDGDRRIYRECLALEVKRNLKSDDVLVVLDRLFIYRGIPEHIHSDNGPEFTAEIVRDWLETLMVKPLYIESGSPWENGYVESFHGRFRDEILNAELFDTLWDTQVLIEQWRRDYNTIRPHSSLGYRPPAPEACLGSLGIPLLHRANHVTTTLTKPAL